MLQFLCVVMCAEPIVFSQRDNTDNAFKLIVTYTFVVLHQRP